MMTTKRPIINTSLVFVDELAQTQLFAGQAYHLYALNICVLTYRRF